MKSYSYPFMEEEYNLGFVFARYTNNRNLYVGLINLGNEDDPYFCDLTINVASLPFCTATIDDCLDSCICDWLERIGAGKSCNQRMQGGFRSYPLFEFDPQFLQEANPESYNTLL